MVSLTIAIVLSRCTVLKHVILALYASIIEPPAPVGSAAELALKAHIGGKRIYIPARTAPGELAQLTRDDVCHPAVADSLAIRRVGDNRARLALQNHVAHVHYLDLDPSTQSRLTDMPPGKLNRFRVDVGACDANLALLPLVRTALRLAANAFERRYVGERPFFHGERPPETRRAVERNERRFDQKRARAAAGIIQRLPRMPPAGQNQRGGQRLAQRRFAVPRAIAAPG